MNTAQSDLPTDERLAALRADPGSYYDTEAERALCSASVVLAVRQVPPGLFKSQNTAAALMVVSEPTMTIQAANSRVTRVRYAMHTRGALHIDGSATALSQVDGSHLEASVRSRWGSAVIQQPRGQASHATVNLSSQQTDAIIRIRAWYASKLKGVFRLFGYAGTGKTTIARELPDALGCNIAFVTYTGKAASVLIAKGCTDASTIHRALYQWIPRDDGGPSDRIINHAGAIAKCDLVVLDECSMVDSHLAKDILSLNKPVIAMGDLMQLPPINGAGYFTNAKADYLLTELHRQALDNPITRMSLDLREGRRLKRGSYGDSLILKLNALPLDRLMKADQVLAGRKATCGAVGHALRNLFGRTAPLPMPGDKLMCLRNNRNKGLLNGQVWTALSCTQINGATVSLQIQSETGDRKLKVQCLTGPLTGTIFPVSELDQARSERFGYADVITVHKSQGSEWDNVVLFDESQIYKDDARRWLYTGITRTSKAITVIET
ncbi:AAA family ATPase [Tardiphaga sp. vice304]|nr:AAA family ATPase [Tardiphaga sp. vice304]